MKNEIASKSSRKRIFIASAIIMPIILAFSAFAVVSATVPPQAAVVNPTQAADTSMYAIGAAISISMTGISAGYALAKSGSAAIASLAEKPETFFKAFLVVVLCEAIAIYGLIIAILLWLRL